MTQAVVVGSGPNGLAAAITLARAGVQVTVLEAEDVPGGGARTSEHTVPGLLHDDCSAFHPTGVISPFFAGLDLHEHGLQWLWPEIDLAHPLPDGRAALLSRDMDVTVASLDVDGDRWRRVFAPLAADVDALLDDVFRPLLHVPSHPLRLARFGAFSVLPATVAARLFRDEPARALLTGVAAHLFGRLDVPLTASVGMLLASAGHRAGWPVAQGGSGAIAAALVSVLESYGGQVRTGVRVADMAQVREVYGRDPDVLMLDLAPEGVLRLVGDTMPLRVRRAYQRFRYGPAAFKVDFAVRGHVPWTNPDVRRAGTVHLGGTARQVAAAEAAIARGEMPQEPFVLVGQQYLADPSRSVGDLHPVWAYAHVPHGWTGDATAVITAQIEKYAPGFTGQVEASFSRDVAAMTAHNANYVGGDISAGANTPWQIVARPRAALDPYRVGPGTWICSSSTPPGGGVHGMCGHNAALSVLSA
ncbi:phytoene desaturase family protein [Nocardioides yefusunii]|uniref:Phytoene desaturase family protein n=1 Tax=Nocardioides yefusunii TaxID=2500546 RepID=A0ABW1QYZ0_9ACTN|nr:NAD(P)/FAD-dependent oxidoreductase [Nocardioides yefusunii]